MARINLLPWREQQRRERQKQFLMIAGLSAVLMLLVVGYVHIHFGRLIDFQNNRNAFLQREITELDRQLAEIKELESTKTKLLARMNIIEELQRSRPGVVHLFDEIARTLPEGIYLTEVVQQGTGLNVKGVAQSNARVSAYMRNIEGSGWLGNPRLDVIETKVKSGVRQSDFTLHAEQTGLTTGEEPEAGDTQ